VATDIFEANYKVLQTARKYKMSLQDMDSMIYYELREHYKTKPPTFEEFLTNPITFPT